MSPHQRDLLMLGLAALLALLCLGFALRAGRRRRLIDCLPTCKTSGVFIGLVELKGTAEAELPLTSFLAESPCVYFAYTVQEHWSRTVRETYRDSQGRTHTRTRHESGWTTVASGGDQTPFYLRDDTGVLLIRPDGAKVEPAEVFDTTCGRSDPLYYDRGPAHAVSHSDHRRRFHEVAIPLHAQIYIVGQARERADIVAPEIATDRDAPLFLISTRTEAQISSGYKYTFWGLGILGLLLWTAGWVLRDHLAGLDPTGRDAAERIPLYFGVAAGFVLAWFLGWGWMVYNSLIDLRQRVRQAWANVDVQLKRRNDLIPNLVRVVEGLRDHERRVQTAVAQERSELAQAAVAEARNPRIETRESGLRSQRMQTAVSEMRSQLEATAPGRPGPDPRGVGPLLRGILESYPELGANELFLDLQRRLVDTEQRIALARGYFNEVATFYNTRLEIVPDRYVGALARLAPQKLIEATDFERAPVTVELAS
ncbi:MAG: LemA family protein [Planctomycetota bacterium]